ncbi:MAG: flavodoxin-dependent (E)-4-hydroxy-3-methylbut-2-enyl-diphosphate synthase [Chitinivibrionales bacterium]|nr:flavodoxin-dependent (E)-4-hydroxy-3-methylbut-2-enyl-diphosphate synthase [Chitinivibrionales bacterium]MBD3397411.1 flavodoxin-dependent (E)-4-hydroxy-3-methylbut-2-enyl-diphosphate synthase [Chitinivibrionales bacterium]
MTLPRRKTQQVMVRNVPVGGDAPVAIQSMCNTATTDASATLAQIEGLVKAGCHIVRLAVPNREAVKAFANIRKKTDVPLVADIHFQADLAVAAFDAGADKVRINPGNIGGEAKVRAIVDAAKKAGAPIRVGVNSGSVEKEILKKHGGATPDALVESAAASVAMMQRLEFDNLVFSIKASDVVTTIQACRAFAGQFDFPQHIGITESGTVRTGTIRSSVGLGTLLAQGIGDTIRVSLAGDPLQEVRVCKEILKSLGLAKGPTVIACPTCGRTQIDVAGLAEKVEDMVAGMTADIKIAVMGCVVNGPGEAKEADVGMAGGKGSGEIFVRGEVVEKVKEEDMLDRLMAHVHGAITNVE